MASVSKLEKYKSQIEHLIYMDVSIRSAWKIINHSLHEEAKMSYSAFYHFVKKEIKRE